MRFHCKQGANAPACLVSVPLARLQQPSNLVEFTIYQQIEANRWLRADRQNAAGEVFGQRVIKRAFKNVIKRGDEAARVQVKDVLGNDE